jgi:phenylalanyl-tRNA synthetase beta chain
MLNPLSSDLNTLRQTLLFNGLEAIEYNSNRQNPNLRLFEYGRCYRKSEKSNEHYPLAAYLEDKRLAIYLTGNKSEPSWTVPEEKVSYFHLKAYCEVIFDKLGINKDSLRISSLEDQEDIFTDGIAYYAGKKLVLELGSVNKQLLKKFDIEQEVFCAEFRWDRLIKMANHSISFKELPKFPEVRRDLALLIEQKITFQEIITIVKQVEKKIVKKVDLFDFYQGKGIPEGKKSYGVSFYLQNEEKTLTDKEIDSIMKKISDKLTKELNAELR